ETEEHLADRRRDVLERDAALTQQRAETAVGLLVLGGERCGERVGIDPATVHEHVAEAHGAHLRAGPDRAAVREHDVDSLPVALALELAAGTREPEELHHVAGHEPRQVAFERGRRRCVGIERRGLRRCCHVHCFPHRTSPTTRPFASTAPRITRRLYQPSASTWSTPAASSTPRAVAVSGNSRSAGCPPGGWRKGNRP